MTRGSSLSIPNLLNLSSLAEPEELVRRNRCSLTGGVTPDAVQNLSLARSLTSAAIQEASRRGTSVVVLAIDGLSFGELNVSGIPGADAIALTSSFPSTSVVAWAETNCFATMAEHGLPGVTFLDEHTNQVIHAFRQTSLSEPGIEWSESMPSDYQVPGFPTIFDAADAAGLRSYSILGELASLPSSWRSLVTSGSRLVDADPNPRTLADGVRASLNACQDILHEGDDSLIWVWFNFDDHVHAHGYDAVAGRLIDDLMAAASALAATGNIVIAVSDHGNRSMMWDADVFDRVGELSDRRWNRLPVGGAGNVRWYYPRPRCEDELARELSVALGDNAVVCGKHELVESGLLPNDHRLLGKLGEIITLAVGPSFYGPDSTLPFEHGSTSVEEMLVPLVLWCND